MNPIRPDGFEGERSDCTVRALSSVTKIDYATVHKVLTQAGRKRGRGINFRFVADDVFTSLNLNSWKVKSEKTKTITVDKFVKKYPKGRFLCLKRGHAFPIINGEYYDVKSKNVRIIIAWKLEVKE